MCGGAIGPGGIPAGPILMPPLIVESERLIIEQPTPLFPREDGSCEQCKPYGELGGMQPPFTQTPFKRPNIAVSRMVPHQLSSSSTGIEVMVSKVVKPSLIKFTSAICSPQKAAPWETAAM